MGSGGGYVRVAPAGEEAVGRDVSSVDITRYLERDHDTRRPSGRSKRYRHRLKRAVFGGTGRFVVKGFAFYSWARKDALSHGLDAARQVLDWLEDQFEID